MAGFDQSDVRACIEPPDKSRIDGILAFSERTGRENAADSAAYAQPLVGIEEQTWALYGGPGKITVLAVEPLKEPYVKQIDTV